MAEGIIRTLKLSAGNGVRFGFVTCPGKDDLRFEESDLVGVEMTADLRGRRVTYNEAGGRAERVRLLD